MEACTSQTPMVPIVVNPNRAYVFFDIAVKDEFIGRVIFELFVDIAPRTCENFRSLCTGERGVGLSGKVLSYKGSIFHRIIRDFMIQGGDITNFNGSGGESVYGYKFEDENFIVKHDRPGQLAMANAGPNTQNSQYYITLVPGLQHLDNKHCIFGQVIKGMPVVKQIECLPTATGDIPIDRCVVVDCGQIIPGGDFGLIDNDGTGDIYPHYPEDGEFDFHNIDAICSIAQAIKVAGNIFYKREDYVRANLKYKKALRYLNKLHEQDISPEVEQRLLTLEMPCLLNCAASNLKVKKYDQAIEILNEALEISPDNPKAFYRRGQAWHGKRDYEKSIQDLKKALQILPNDKAIISELVAVKGEIQAYHAKEKQMFSRIFNKS